MEASKIKDSLSERRQCSVNYEYYIVNAYKHENEEINL